MCIVKDGEKETSAYLSSESNMTSFRFGSQNIRFRTSSKLERYISVKEWDKGYIVVMAKYRDLGEIEDYIDLVPILRTYSPEFVYKSQRIFETYKIRSNQIQ